jgi:hypothetical protein
VSLACNLGHATNYISRILTDLERGSSEVPERAVATL